MAFELRIRDRLSRLFRNRRNAALRELIDSIAKRKGYVGVVDVGGTVEYWQRVGFDFLRERKVTVTIINLRESGISDVGTADNILQIKIGDGCHLPEYATGEFDLAHSNSVIEHVVTWGNMKKFASETRRIGRSYYVQTPYFWFPVDPHYYAFPMFHWLPRPLRARILNLLPIAHSGRISGVDMAFEVIDGARLLDGRQFQFLFPDSTITYERAAGFIKSMVAVRHSEEN